MTLEEINNVFFKEDQMSEAKIKLKNKNILKIKKINEKTLHLWISIPALIINPKMIYRFDAHNNLIKEQIRFNLIQSILCHVVLPIIIFNEFFKNQIPLELNEYWEIFVFLILFSFGLQILIGFLIKEKIKAEIQNLLLKTKE